MNNTHLFGTGKTQKLVGLFMATALVTTGCGTDKSKDCEDKNRDPDEACKEGRSGSSGGSHYYPSGGKKSDGSSGISSGSKSKGGVGSGSGGGWFSGG